jgi:hypothetical protein
MCATSDRYRGTVGSKWIVRVQISESEDLGLEQVKNVWIRIDRNHNNHLFDRLGRTKVSLRASTATMPQRLHPKHAA